MNVEQRPIKVFVDIDRTQNIGPPAVKTAIALYTNKLRLPPKDQELTLKEPKNVIRRTISVVWHGIRPFTRDSYKGLETIHELSLEQAQQNRSISMAVLSGRDQELHVLTKWLLEHSRRHRFFTDTPRLNTFNSSSGFKEQQIRAEVASGKIVVLFEDDLMAALRANRINEEYEENPVHIYLIRNAANATWLRKRANVEQLPETIQLVHSFQEGAIDFKQKVLNGTI